jgi:hypothetical protein
MSDVLWGLLGFVVILFWLINITVILPKLRKQRTIYIADWLFTGYHQIKNLFDYKDICLKKNVPLFWYKTQVFLAAAFLGITVLEIFLGL